MKFLLSYGYYKAWMAWKNNTFNYKTLCVFKGRSLGVLLFSFLTICFISYFSSHSLIIKQVITHNQDAMSKC